MLGGVTATGDLDIFGLTEAPNSICTIGSCAGSVLAIP